MLVSPMQGDPLKGSRIDPEKWYSARDAARLLEVTELTVTRYCRDGTQLARVKKIGPKGRWHVLGSEILRRRRELELDAKRD
jgi:hypothetical protein